MVSGWPLLEAGSQSADDPPPPQKDPEIASLGLGRHSRGRPAPGADSYWGEISPDQLHWGPREGDLSERTPSGREAWGRGRGYRDPGSLTGQTQRHRGSQACGGRARTRLHALRSPPPTLAPGRGGWEQSERGRPQPALRLAGRALPRCAGAREAAARPPCPRPVREACWSAGERPVRFPFLFNRSFMAFQKPG